MKWMLCLILVFDFRLLKWVDRTVAQPNRAPAEEHLEIGTGEAAAADPERGQADRGAGRVTLSWGRFAIGRLPPRGGEEADYKSAPRQAPTLNCRSGGCCGARTPAASPCG